MHTQSVKKKCESVFKRTYFIQSLIQIVSICKHLSSIFSLTAAGERIFVFIGIFEPSNILCIFHMFIAQLKTIHQNESGPHMQLTKVLESMKILRDQYEQHAVEHSIWESNEHHSIGMRLKIVSLVI